MPLTRVFLDWKQPALAASADYLMDRFRGGGRADLGNAVLVLPGSRAGRRLLEILVEQAGRQGLSLIPPQITTVGVLPELLYQARRPFAEDIVQRLVWAEALSGADRTTLSEILAEPPAEADWPRWLELARVFGALHRELASDTLDFADVAGPAQAIAGPRETRRWQALARIQQEYLRRLDGLEFWDRQTARRVAIQRRECRTDREIVLIGAVDLDRTVRRMLEQTAERVTAIVCAPASWAERFDEHGCLKPESWRSAPLDLPSGRLRQADSPSDQSQAVAGRLAEFAGRYRADEVAIGLPDERLAPEIERRLHECGVPSRWGPGRPLAETGVWRLVAAVAGYAERGGFHEFAELVRHPDVGAWIEQQGVCSEWLSELDQYCVDHLPVRLDGRWLGDPGKCERIRRVHEAVDRLVRSLRGEDASGPGGSRKLGQWSKPLLQLVLNVYQRREFDSNDPADGAVLTACRELQTALARWEAIPDRLAPAARLGEAVRLVLDELALVRVAPPPREGALELLGWLELPLDDAPALIVTSFNEGFVPKSVNQDEFLPNSLRRRLALDDNQRRYARDAYALRVLLAPWRDATLIVGRRDVEGNPLTPSRLLFAAEPELVAERVLSFFSSSRPASAAPATERGGLTDGPEEMAFAPPQPEPLAEPLARMRVTGFRSYLACPYRYYLTHILGLAVLSDDVEELDGASFGTLAHEVLRQFGRSEERDAEDAERIRRRLHDSLDRTVRQRYGRRPSPPVSVQVEQLRLRLDAFALWQADRAGAGWRIRYVEAPPHGEYGELLVDGEPIQLSGRIDRIDWRDETGEWAILDYKTSDSPKAPEKTHRKGGQWIDLQLPLYHHLARGLGVDGSVRLGFLQLPKDTAAVKAVWAEWTEGELAEAMDVARDVVRRVRRGEFWPPRDPPPDYSEDLAPICLDGVFGKPKYSDIVEPSP